VLKISSFIITAYLGLSIFFSFVTAPILFKTIEKQLAGMVVGKIFPIYFTVGVVVFAISGIFFLKQPGMKSYFILTLIILGILLIQLLYVLPSSENLKVSNYDVFMKVHAASMILNAIMILLTGILSLLLFNFHLK